MNKHIGTRIVVMVALLALVFGVNIVSSLFTLDKIKSSSYKMSNVYVELECNKGDLIGEIGDCKLYINLLALMDDEEETTGIANTCSELSASMDATLEELQSLCEQTESETLLANFDAYKTEIANLQKMLTDAADANLAGDMDTVAEAKQNVYAQIQAVEEKGTTYVESMEEQQKADEAVMDESFYNMFHVMIGMVIAFLVILVLIIVFVIKTVSMPARKASKQLDVIIDKIERNEGDLNDRIVIKSQDEIGQLVKGVNNFIGQLQLIMKKIQTETSSMQDSVDAMTSQVGESNENATNVSAAMEELSASMQEVAATVEQLMNGSKNVLEQAKAMSEESQRGTEFVQEVKKRAKEMHDSTMTSKERTDRMVHEIRGALEESIENSRSVDKINELTGDILDISSQTNLLALNASIEAARAGEAGKGFAVVADEIRVLADNSRDTANNIQKISEGVIEAVETLSKNADQMLQFVNTNVMDDYGSFVETAERYRQDADSMNEFLTQFAEGSVSLEETMGSMNAGIEGIATNVDESAKGVSSAAESTSQLVDSITGIQSESEINQAVAAKLSEEVKRFKNI